MKQIKEHPIKNGGAPTNYKKDCSPTKPCQDHNYKSVNRLTKRH